MEIYPLELIRSIYSSQIDETRHITWAEWVSTCQNPLVTPRKEDVPLYRPSSRLDPTKDSRGQGNVASLWALILDVDEGDEASWQAAIAGLAPYAHATHTSHNHRVAGKPYKWRSIILLSRPVSPGEYRALSETLTAQLTGVAVDPASHKPAQWYYAPSHPPGATDVRCVVSEAPPLPVDDLLAHWSEPQRREKVIGPKQAATPGGWDESAEWIEDERIWRLKPCPLPRADREGICGSSGWLSQDRATWRCWSTKCLAHDHPIWRERVDWLINHALSTDSPELSRVEWQARLHPPLNLGVLEATYSTIDLPEATTLTKRRALEHVPVGEAREVQVATETGIVTETLQRTEAVYSPEPDLTVLVYPTGLGKTKRLLEHTLTHPKPDRLVLAFPRHDLLRQALTDAQAMGLRNYRYTVALTAADPQTHEPYCRRLPEAERLIQVGISVRRTLCNGDDGSWKPTEGGPAGALWRDRPSETACPYRDSCQAYKRILGDSGPLFTTHEMLRYLLSDGSVGPGSIVIFDESPPEVEVASVTDSYLRRVRAGAWAQSHPEVAAVIDVMLSYPTAEGENGYSGHTGLTSISRIDVPFRPPPGVDDDLSGHPNADLEAVLGSSVKSRVGDSWLVYKPIEWAYQDKGGLRGVILSATGNYRVSKTERTLMYTTPDYTNRYWIPEGANRERIFNLQNYSTFSDRRVKEIKREAPIFAHPLLVKNLRITRDRKTTRNRNASELKNGYRETASLSIFNQVRSILLTMRAQPYDGRYRVGIITYKDLAYWFNWALRVRSEDDPHLQEGHATYLARLIEWMDHYHIDLQVGHFGATSGLNSMETVNTLIVYGTPNPRPAEVEAQAWQLSLDPYDLQRRLIQTELEQALGRARGVRRGDINLVIVGKVIPPHWVPTEAKRGDMIVCDSSYQTDDTECDV